MNAETPYQYAPADPGDIRFEMFELENEDTPYGLLMIDDKGVVVEQHAFASTMERSSLIASFRECQDTTLEERLAPFGIEWQREQEERRGWSL